MIVFEVPAIISPAAQIAVAIGERQPMVHGKAFRYRIPGEMKALAMPIVPRWMDAVPSGGASGGGAVLGGEGAPGSGTGTPGALTSGRTH